MIRLAVRVARADADVVLAELLDLSPAGLEEVEHADGTVEYAIYGAPGELPGLPALRAAAGEALVDVTTSELADDWSERWREFHAPVTVAGRVRIRPPWEDASGPAEVGAREPAAREAGGSAAHAGGVAPIDIVIDPGQAFGTGAHATTRLCLELLIGLPPRGALVDVGSGSGVLAIAAAKLGWSPVTALDNDRESVAATIANAAANGVELDARRLDLRREPLPGSDTVVANLLEPLLRELALRLTGDSPQTLIAGGLLASQADAIAREFATAHGFSEARRLASGEWAALLLTR